MDNGYKSGSFEKKLLGYVAGDAIYPNETAMTEAARTLEASERELRKAVLENLKLKVGLRK